jgi:hypothetical protein
MRQGSMMAPLRVLFVHGLESGPQGRKSRALREAGFDVVAEAMPCSQRSMLRDPFTLGLFAFATLAMILGMQMGWRGALGTALLVAVAAPTGLRVVIRRAFRRSVLVQERALREHAIDVVLGSSYGGAVALELLRKGTWKGPTVLLCPAHRLVAERARLPFVAFVLGADVCIVHGTKDTTVPIAHSRALVANSAATLLEVDDDHRLNQSATPTKLAEWIALAMGR